MPELSVASFNTHYGFRTRPHAPRTPYDVAAALHALDADVIVVQEVWRPDGQRGPLDAAAEVLGLTVHHEVTGQATAMKHWPHLVRNGEGTVGIAVLTGLPARRVGTIALGPTAGDPAPARTALQVEVDVDGSALPVVAVHLTSRLLHGPMLQLRQLAQAVPDGDAAVVAGDCNFWGPGVRMYLRGWRRAVRGRTWPARFPHSQIDHVLVRPTMKVRRGEVLPDVGSDHRPVRAELSW